MNDNIDFQYWYNDDMKDNYDQDLALQREADWNDILEESINLVMCFEGRTQNIRQKLTTVSNFTDLHDAFWKNKNYPKSGSKMGKETGSLTDKTLVQLKHAALRVINDPTKREYYPETVAKWSYILNSIPSWEAFLAQHKDSNPRICVYWYKE